MHRIGLSSEFHLWRWSSVDPFREVTSGMIAVGQFSDRVSLSPIVISAEHHCRQSCDTLSENWSTAIIPEVTSRNGSTLLHLHKWNSLDKPIRCKYPFPHQWLSSPTIPARQAAVVEQGLGGSRFLHIWSPLPSPSSTPPSHVDEDSARSITAG